MESLTHAPDSQMANAWVAGISADHTWEPKDGMISGAEGSYQLRAAAGRTRQRSWSTSGTSGRRAIASTSGRSEAIASLSLGYISGNAPLFERFSLGNSTTLRGWDKYDIAPARRRAHVPFVDRVSTTAHIAVFFDAGSVWDRDADMNLRYSTGFGVHSDNSFLTLGFPLNSDNAGATSWRGYGFEPRGSSGVALADGSADAHVRRFSARGLAAQTLTVNAAGDALRVQARDFAFIEGPLLTRLKEGRSVRVDFELTVLVEAGRPDREADRTGVHVEFRSVGGAVRRVTSGIAASLDLSPARE